MREILFRGKRVDNGEWVEGFFCGESCDSIFSPMYEQANIIKKGTGVWSAVIPETVGQYTGLKDKNGKRIFDGDICQIKNHRLIDDTPFVVEWEDFIYNGWVWKDIDEDEREDSFTQSVARICEILGNIHDNPELLKEV